MKSKPCTGIYNVFYRSFPAALHRRDFYTLYSPAEFLVPSDSKRTSRRSVHGSVRIGVSGWRYKGWRGVFYPRKLPQPRELSYLASIFPSVEINGTFYSLQRPESFARWAAATPADFVFAVKGPRYITHLRRLKDIEAPLANFFASGILRLGSKLGPILLQFPPNFRFDPERIEAFFALLPHDTESAAALARRRRPKNQSAIKRNARAVPAYQN